MSRIIGVIRHGESHYRDQSGDLTAHGIGQVNKLAQIPFVRRFVNEALAAQNVFCSPTMRTRETARRILDVDEEPFVRADMRPIWLNTQEQEDARQRYLTNLDRWRAQLNMAAPFERIDQANSIQLKQFLEDLRHATGPCLVFGHLETIRALIVNHLFCLGHLVPPPGSLTIFGPKEKQVRCIWPSED